MRIKALIRPNFRGKHRHSTLYRTVRLIMIVVPLVAFVLTGMKHLWLGMDDGQVTAELKDLQQREAELLSQIKANLVSNSEGESLRAKIDLLNRNADLEKNSPRIALGKLERIVPPGVKLSTLTLKREATAVGVSLTGSAAEARALAEVATRLSELGSDGVQVSSWNLGPTGSLLFQAAGRMDVGR
ncbi:MAG: hypothetical protein HY815_07725 [Candidatus Riflebacteria bacterium]|nr:hypothetical protein [Candidatus Riflebacteria bacterium]